jgi:MoaA/NifB/PqqE/SkfB family radical SAM enzyme
MPEKSNELKETIQKERRASTRFFEQFVAIKNKNGEKYIFIFGKALKIKKLFAPPPPPPTLQPLSELENRRKLYFRPNYYGNIDSIEFSITRKCNYRCEYCCAGLGNDKNDKATEASEETVRSFIGLLLKIKNKSRIKIIGGEPILHPMFFEVAGEIIKNGHSLVVGTNFSLPNKNFEKICDLIKFDGQLKIVASLHLSQVQSVDWFVDKVVSLKKYAGKKINIEVVSVLTEDNFSVLKDVREKFLLNKISFSLMRLVVKEGFHYYSPEVESYYQSVVMTNKASSKFKERIVGLNTYGLMCKTGYSFLHILPSGDVIRCYGKKCYDTVKQKNIGMFYLGDIKRVVWTLKEPLPCLETKCTCLLPVTQGLILFEKRDAKLAKKIEQDLPISINSKS